MFAQIAIQKKMTEAFLESRVRNPAFSLRAYARKLQMSPAAVSEILHGKRRISKKMADRVLRSLSVEENEANSILALFPDERRSVRRTEFGDHEGDFGADRYHLIGEWQHAAILALAKTSEFQSHPLWIAERLGIRPSEAEEALSRLKRLGLLDAERSLEQSGAPVPEEILKLARRKAQAQSLEKSKKRLDQSREIPEEFMTLALAVDQARLAEARALMQEFAHKLKSLLSEGAPSEVYQLGIQLVPLTE